MSEPKDTRTALEIATAALERISAKVTWSQTHTCKRAPECVFCDAREALAAMRAAPGLENDVDCVAMVRDAYVISGPWGAIRAIDAYQREKAGLR